MKFSWKTWLLPCVLLALSVCVLCVFSVSLLLSTVSGEGVKERSDRVLLAPWVKFLWESNRNMLELLKNNNTIERVYADVAKDGEKDVCCVVTVCMIERFS